MNGNSYQQLAMRTNDGKSGKRLMDAVIWTGNIRSNTIKIGDLMNGCLGLTGEVGEFCDMIKKWIFHETEIDFSHLKKELGDVMWYVALICHAMHWDLSEIMEQNIEKLKARYPEGFNPELSKNRKEGDL